VDERGKRKAKTSHTLNPVPFYFYDKVSNGAIRIAGGRSFGLSNVAASTVNLLGYAAPEMWDRGIFEFG
jgi:2,3-bisphosphoglycerate-independent phosphoglycerate mutase